MQEGNFTSFFFSTTVVSLATGINTVSVSLWYPAPITTQLKDGKILLGKPLLKNLYDEAPKKVGVQI